MKADKIIKKDHAYHAHRVRETGEEYYQKISNFTMQVERCFINTESGEITREIIFKGGDEKAFGPFTIDAETALTTSKFQAFCFSRGLFFFEGLKKDLVEIWKLESQNAKVFIQEAPHVGYLAKYQTYLFEDLALQSSQVVVLPKDNIFRIDESTLLSFRRFSGAAGRLPHMSAAIDLDPSESPLLELHALLELNLKKQGKLVLAWAVLVILMPHIVARYKRFPHLFLSGKTQSGKTTLAAWLMSIFGIHAEGLSIRETTPYAITEMLSYYSGLPVWLDEYRVRDQKCVEKHDLLKNAYDRQSSVKGKLGRKWEEISVNGCLLLTGEEFPNVHSILSRCVCLELSAKQRDDKPEVYERLNQLQPTFPKVFREVLDRLTPKRLQTFFRYQRRVERYLITTVRDPRIAFNYSLLIAAYKLFLALEKDEFPRWLMEYARKDREAKDNEKLTYQFLTDVIGMIEDGVINDSYYMLEQSNDESRFYLALEPVYRHWEKQQKLRGNPVTYVYKTLKRDLKEEDFYNEKESEDKMGLKRKNILGHSRRCVCFDFSKFPFFIQDDLENLILGDKPPEKPLSSS
jgi:hypothetical protein